MQIILADNQAIFCNGIVKVLLAEPTIQVIAQCTDLEGLRIAIDQLEPSIVVFPSSITEDLDGLLDLIQLARSRSVMILEQDGSLDESLLKRIDGTILRSVTSSQLIDCLCRVDIGERYEQRAVAKTLPFPDQAGTKAVRRLTPKELQIVALISEGCKNKEIARQLGTKEQVVKNYLRSIYGKTGVSDRLELALFTIHHHVLAEVVETARLALVRSA